MAEQIINNGSSAGDPTAENIYTSFGKTKSNFSELYAFIPTLLAKAGGIMTGVLQFATGTAAAPSAKIGGDQKGFYEVGANTLGVTIAGAKVGEFNAYGLQMDFPRIVVVDKKANGVDGGTATAGVNYRDLTTVLRNNIFGASLASNKITLPIGRYYIKEISAPANSVNNHKIRLYNNTNAVVQTDINGNAIVGTSANSSSSDYTSNRSIIRGYYFDVSTTPKDFKIQHEVLNTFAASGFGAASSFGDSEIYTIVEIEKVG